jgi:hypothetical protein
MSERTSGAVLVARKDSEYYFVDSVFKHDDDFFGCTGVSCYPVTEDMMDDMLSTDNLVERYGDFWEEKYGDDVKDDCENCNGFIDEEGCEDCDYPSVESFCDEIGRYDGSDAVIDNPGGGYAEALNEVCDCEVEYADCGGGGRIFGSFNRDKPLTPGYFDEVYNMKALVACLAYEDGAVSYEYAVKAIFGNS